MLPKTSSPKRNVTEHHDRRREILDDMATFHLAIQISLFPAESPARLPLSISELETELMARSLRMRAECERILARLAAQKARLRTDILPFLTV